MTKDFQTHGIFRTQKSLFFIYDLSYEYAHQIIAYFL